MDHIIFILEWDHCMIKNIIRVVFTFMHIK